MSDYSKLKALAEAATPGPWSYDGSYVCPARVESGTTYVETWRLVADCHQPENTQFIAAANPAAVLGLLDDNQRLESYKTAYMEWSDKTDWVQETAEVRELGKHRADVIRDRFDALKAECEGLRNALSECATSLEGEMLQKFHGQKPDDMHPVTRRDYDRDMEELGGYQAVLGQGGQSNG